MPDIKGINVRTTQTLFEYEKGIPKADANLPSIIDATDKVSIRKLVSATDIQIVIGDNIARRIQADAGISEAEWESLSSLDLSPESTAQRIVDFVTSFWGAYAEQHADEPPEEVAAGFEKLVRNSVQEGFDEAMEILSAYEVADDTVSTAQTTIDLVTEKLDKFFESLMQPQQDQPATASEEAV